MLQDKRFPKTGSPFQMDFPGEDRTPKGMTPLNGSIPACWDAAQRCSCGDCPSAPQCTPVSAFATEAASHVTAFHCHTSCIRLSSVASAECVSWCAWQVPPPPPLEQPGCSALGLHFLRCSDLGLGLLWLAVMAVLFWAFATPKVPGLL